MRFFRQRFAALSRDPRFLRRTVVWILLPGLAVAFVIGLLRDSSAQRNSESADAADAEMKSLTVTSRAASWKLLELVRSAKAMATAGVGDLYQVEDVERATAPAAALYWGPLEQQTFKVYRTTMLRGGAPEATALEALQKAHTEEPGSGIIGSMHGDLLRLDGKFEEALAAYEQGSNDREAGSDSRRRGLELCLRRGWSDRLRNLYHKQEWRDALLESDAEGSGVAGNIAVTARDWPMLFRLSVRGVLERLRSPQWSTMASLTAMLWFLVIHVGAGVPLRKWWRGLLGFALGLMSIPVTHFFIFLQESWFGIEPHSTGLDDLFYCISGIGLREELAKLLLFTPMLLFLRKENAAHALAVASSVGLGFAALENVGYFEVYTTSAVWARFLTANFLHFALTGITGLGLWLALRNPARWLQHFTIVLVGAVLFHGLWDWSSADPRLSGDVEFLKIAGLAGLSYWYFRDLLYFSQPKPGVPSAVFIFLAGGAFTLSVLLSVSAWNVGFRLALVGTFEPVVSLFAIGAAMYYQLRRS